MNFLTVRNDVSLKHIPHLPKWILPCAPKQAFPYFSAVTSWCLLWCLCTFFVFALIQYFYVIVCIIRAPIACVWNLFSYAIWHTMRMRVGQEYPVVASKSIRVLLFRWVFCIKKAQPVFIRFFNEFYRETNRRVHTTLQRGDRRSSWNSAKRPLRNVSTIKKVFYNRVKILPKEIWKMPWSSIFEIYHKLVLQ